MAKEIEVKLITMGGEEKDIETPTDIKAEDFIKELAAALRLPVDDREGRPVSWRIDNKETGKTLDGAKTLEENEVREGHRLILMRTTAAGCFAESTQVMLPSGDYAPLGSIKPHDSILTFDPETSSYLSGQVKGVYLETYSRQVVINNRLVTTPDQHLLLANRTWTTANYLTEGDVLLEFPFKRTVVEEVRTVEGLTPMLSLTLKHPLCFVAEGCVVRDLLGKQEKLQKAVDVFLSYSAADKDEARAIFDVLEKNGVSVFLAERSIEAGQPWEGVVKEALKNCRNFWLLVTPDSLRSEWVITEWASAWALEKHIVPILFRCRPEDLPPRLRAYQCVDFHRVGDAVGSLRRKG
jgi:hypothetical protein